MLSARLRNSLPRAVIVRATSTTIQSISSTTQTEDTAAIALTLSPLDFSKDASATLNDFTATFTNLKQAKAHYREKVIQGNRELKHMYAGSPQIQHIFRQLFSEIVGKPRYYRNSTTRSRW